MFFLEILQSFLPIDKEYENNCSELFEFFETVARQVFSLLCSEIIRVIDMFHCLHTNTENHSDDRGATEYCSEDYYKALYERLIQTIMNHPSSEVFYFYPLTGAKRHILSPLLLMVSSLHSYC